MPPHAIVCILNMNILTVLVCFILNEVALAQQPLCSNSHGFFYFIFFPLSFHWISPAALWKVLVILFLASCGATFEASFQLENRGIQGAT